MDVTYCKYGTPYRKQTRLWTNMRWRPRRSLCKPGTAARRGRTAGTSCRAVRGDCARGHGGACGAAEHSGLGFSGRCQPKIAQRDPPSFLFFGRTQKRCHSAPKMVKRDTGPFFCRFCSTSKAVSLNTKNGAEGHRAPFFPFFGRIQKRCHAASKMKQSGTGP